MSSAPVVLINTNEMKPPVAPIAIDYLAGALRASGYGVDVLDLNFEDARQALKAYFSANQPRLVGLTFRNSDDCFWPSATSFVPRLVELVRAVRQLTDVPVVLGGAGFSVFPQALLAACDCEWGIRGDGEEALIGLLQAVEGGKDYRGIPGLVWRDERPGGVAYVCNPPQPGPTLHVATARDAVDNRRYFREGGQGNVETKRGCPRDCSYCADPLIKGSHVRKRRPDEVADEVESLLRQGVDVLHLCDGEFNIPVDHALEVCREMVRRGLGERVRWYAYASIVPFSDELPGVMRQAGCLGINFGADSACDRMLATYRRGYCKADVAEAIRLCRKHGLRVMIDLLLGGPGETDATLRETIDFLKAASPDCVGSALGVRVYPGTRFATEILAQGGLDSNPSIRRRTRTGGVSLPPEAERLSAGLLLPTFYISEALGERPAQLVRDIIAGDQRFFEPMDEQGLANYNYNDNQPLAEAIAKGARGAYWDILRGMRASGG
jgi:radical SAM superfamily enzyme YgiQ (UPF0313 family)